jgi:ABC-type nitrate/sulfonate/bicarbonate transport system substrate-binding protein
MLAVACTATLPTAQDSPSATTHTPSDTKRGTIRFEVPADADVADVPWLMAIDLLRDQGYTVETVSLSSDLSAGAMAQGDLDIATLSNQRGWAAIGKGAPLVTVMDKSANTFMIIAPKDIRTCADLDGKPVAVNGVTTVGSALFNAYLEKNCPGAKPEILVVKGGSNRTAALLTGEVDAAMQDVDDLIKLERDRPGEFHPLVVFAEEFPGVQINSQVVRRDFAEQHPEMVKDAIHALFTARRSLQAPQVLREAIINYLGLEPDKAQEMADTYLARKIWDVSGAYTLETVQATLDFLQEHGDLPPELEAEDVADLSYYDAVLDEIGRQ